jgi:hypothetical protein
MLKKISDGHFLITYRLSIRSDPLKFSKPFHQNLITPSAGHSRQINPSISKSLNIRPLISTCRMGRGNGGITRIPPAGTIKSPFNVTRNAFDSSKCNE